ncbi:hypothetical protein SUGI_0068130 [Cryptomeria japonica]|nr:hypothetical protein SUGI_0068130 [Cryptomeria japonica]
MATNNEGKIRALEAGLNLCVQNGISKVLIEGDSQVIINDIIKSNFQCWKLSKWLLRINHLLELIDTFEIKHVYHEGNRMADYLAKLGVTQYYLPSDSSEDANNSKEEDSSDSENNDKRSAKRRRMEKAKERERMKTFVENAWEIFRCAVLNGNMNPFGSVTK